MGEGSASKLGHVPVAGFSSSWAVGLRASVPRGQNLPQLPYHTDFIRVNMWEEGVRARRKAPSAVT